MKYTPMWNYIQLGMIIRSVSIAKNWINMNNYSVPYNNILNIVETLKWFKAILHI